MHGDGILRNKFCFKITYLCTNVKMNAQVYALRICVFKNWNYVKNGYCVEESVVVDSLDV